MTTIVALDIETTGLNPEGDAITEIGAVRFNERRIEDEWHSLINPGRRIPPQITQLTGITDAMVRNAPMVGDVVANLDDFVGDAPVLGHNVGFDLAFLRKQNILRYNDPLDTYDMAAVLMPSAGRYKLGALAQSLGILLPATHRALDDARVTHAVYQKMFQEALEMPIDLLAEIVRLGDNVPNWYGYGLFFEALRARSKEKVSGRGGKQGPLGKIFSVKPARDAQPLLPIEDPVPLDPEEVASILEYGGAFSKYFEHYEQRPEQVDMLRSITDAISNGKHLLVEAGTGVGKSFAYLIPAALWAYQNGQRVVISTNTINLQDQLINKDIPDLQQALDLDVRATVQKGRGNYLCPRRFEILRRRGPETPEEIRTMAKVMVWAQGSASGDRSEINLNGPLEREVWSRISASDDGCTAESCLKHTGGACPFYRSRQSAQSAHIIIVNHALLLADIATGNRVIPDYDHLIVDEAHHMESATTNALSFRATQMDFIRILRELGNKNTGIMGRLLNLLHDSVSPSQYATADHLVETATDQTFQLESLSRNFFTTLEQFLFDQREGRDVGPYGQQVRILPSTRTLPAWLDVEIAWEDAQRIMKALIASLEQIAQAVVELSEAGFGEIDLLEDIYSSLTSAYRRVNEIFSSIEALVFDPQADSIYWVEVRSGGRGLTLQAAPLHIGPLMEKHLWHEKQSIILTSATLTTAGEFDYLRNRLSALDAYDLFLGSPFDYENSTLLYIPNNIPEPSDRHGHQRAIESAIIHTGRATGGRMLVLFTSYAQLKTTSQAVAPALADHGIMIYEQGGGASPHTLLENFKSAEQAILLGTRSFWEGVDVPGEALSVVMIVKLPFDVPSDPVIAARSETFEDPFHQYTLPEAILRFRQGFGRLIRTESDRGVVVILDRRVMTKRYGPLFVNSLPQCTQRVGALAGFAPRSRLMAEYMRKITTKYTKGHKGIIFFLCALCVLGVNFTVTAQDTNPITPVTVNSSGELGDKSSQSPSISSEGRFVVFESSEDNLTSDDSIDGAALFIHDRDNDSTEIISPDIDGFLFNPQISADGRTVIFQAEDKNGWVNVFTYDRLTQQTEQVSVNTFGEGANQWAQNPSISGDGRFAAFTSLADNLTHNDTNQTTDVFIHDRVTGFNYLASPTEIAVLLENGRSRAVISDSGQDIAFPSIKSLQGVETKSPNEIVIYNRVLRTSTSIPLYSELNAILFDFDISSNANILAYGVCIADDEQDLIKFVVRDLRSESQQEIARYSLPAGRCEDAPIDLAISGDGTALVLSYPSKPGEIYLVHFDLENGIQTQIDSGDLGAGLDISADGGVVSYVKDVEGIDQVFVWNEGMDIAASYILAGRVADLTGYPLALITIQVDSVKIDGINSDGAIAVRTDAWGYFWINGISPGPVTLLPSKDGYTFEPGKISVNVQSDKKDLSFIYAHEKVLEEAALDIGMPYSRDRGASGPFHGYASGYCTDLVLDAYLWGVDFNIDFAIEQDFKIRPWHFFRWRDARNAHDMWRYFSYSGQMMPHDTAYQPGDIVFFDWSEDGEIDHVSVVSEIRSGGRPSKMYDATGVIASNPSGLAAELPWEPFHERTVRGHARWAGKYEPVSSDLPVGQFLQAALGSTGLEFRIMDGDGNAVSTMEQEIADGYFSDFVWEQTISISDSFSEGKYFLLVVSNPTPQDVPYQLISHIIKDGYITGRVEVKKSLAPGEIVKFPILIEKNEENDITIQLGNSNRRIEGDLDLTIP